MERPKTVPALLRGRSISSIARLALRLPAIIFAAGAGTSPVHAEASSETRSAEVSEAIVVTATRRETMLQQTPISISAITGDAIDRKNIGNLEELSQSVPGFVMGSDALFGYNASIRGIDSAASGIGADTSVGFYVDGVYIGRNALGVFGLNNIERVEVLKGPQGTLFGRNTTAGAVQIITRLPTDETRINAEVSYGNFTNATFKGSLSGGLAPALSGSLAVFHNYRDSYSGPNHFTGGSFQPSRETNVRAALRWQPSSDLDVILRGDFGRTSESPAWPNLVLMPGFSGTASRVTPAAIQATYPYADDVSLDEDTYLRRRQHGGSLEVRYDLADNVRLTSLSSYRDSSMSFLLDSDGGPARGARSWMQSEVQNQISQEFQIYSPGKSDLQWIAGLYYYRERSRSRYFIDRFFLDPADEIAVNPVNTTRSVALFGEIGLKVMRGVKLTAGARYTRETKDFANTQVRDLAPDPALPLPRVLPFPLALRQTTSKTWQQLTPKLSLSFEPSSRSMIYGSVQKGFKSGGNNFTAGNFIANPTFDPETVWSFETGVRSQWLDSRLTLNLTGFFSDYHGLQLRINNGPGQVLLRNAADAHVEGIEFEGSFRITTGLQISGSVSLQQAYFERYAIHAPTAADCINGRFDAGASLCDYSGNRLQRAPRFQGTGSIRYQFRAGGARVDTDLTFSQTSRQYYDDRNQLGPGAYSSLDAYVRVTPPESDFAMSLWGKNLLDQRHYSHLLLLGPSLLGTLSPPRTFGVTLSYAH